MSNIFYLTTRKSIFLSVLFHVLMFHATSLRAQNVTVSEKTGTLLPAKSYDTETGFSAGTFATWKHHQLPLTLTTSDYPDLRESGDLLTHTNNLYNAGLGKGIIMAAGEIHDGYLTITLPKGFRFTGYKFIVQNNVSSFAGISTPHKATLYFTETNNTFQTAKKQINVGRNLSNTEYTLERTSTATQDMGNVLYFRLSNGSNGLLHGVDEYFAVTFKYIELTFTPEENFTVSVEPQTPLTRGTSVAYSNYDTGKIDLGKIEWNTQGGTSRYSYVYTNVDNIQANCLFYEEASVDPRVGTAGSAAGNQTIRSTDINGQNYFVISSGQTYFAESPTEGLRKDGTLSISSPLRFRITKATVNYGSAVSQSSSFYIQGTSDSRFLYTDGRSLWFNNTKQPWNLDQYGLYAVVNNVKYYIEDSYFSSDFLRLGVTKKVSDATHFEIDANNRCVYKYNNKTFVLMDGNWYSVYVQAESSASDYKENLVAHGYEEFFFTPTSTPYKLKISYKPNEVAKEIIVRSAGSVELTGLNNDAVKIEIEGLNGEPVRGCVNLSLGMESLDPFINHMEIVARKERTSNDINDVHLSQVFTSNDFSVGGGEFFFYITKDWLHSPFKFTFEKLSSKYADATYNNDTHGNARYSFVKSDYYNLFANGTYPGNNLYNNPTAAADYDTEKKIYVETAGTAKFKFNNAQEVQSGSDTQFKEFNFTESLYAQPAFGGGSFAPVEITPEIEGTDYTRHAYVFTTDETRYNIAPTWATQHRYYAYYDMHIHLIAKTYTPEVEFKQIYANSYYDNGKTGKFYGAVVKATAEDTHQVGYCSVDDALTLINRELASGKADTPTDMKQLLYVDMGTHLQGVYAVNPDLWTTLKQGLSPNALLFLPKNTTLPLDNTATVEGNYDYTKNLDIQTPSLKACENIVLTDLQPFYTPYNIRVDAANSIRYSRLRSGKNALAKQASIFLPFALEVDREGRHINQLDNCSFKVYTLSPTNFLINAPEEAREGHHYAANFVATHEVQANRCYMILVDDGYEPVGETSFTIDQKGGTLFTTPLGNDNEIIEGVIATATLGNTNIGFISQGTYSGVQIANVFYFANGKFYSSVNLTTADKKVKVGPFRGYFATSQLDLLGKILSFDTVFDAVTTQITVPMPPNTPSQADLAVVVEPGKLTVLARQPQVVTIHDMRGNLIKQWQLRAGETRSQPLLPGVYLVNGKKIMIR